MPDAAWTGIIITLSIFVITHIIVTVWWASKIDTLLSIVRNQIDAIAGELKLSRENFSTKEEVALALKITEKETSGALAIVLKENQALWRNIDEIKLKLK